MLWLIIGIAWLLVALLAVVVARPREGWKAATKDPAEGRISLSTCEYLMALALVEESYAMDCPENIAFAEECTEYMLAKQRKAAG